MNKEYEEYIDCVKKKLLEYNKNNTLNISITIITPEIIVIEWKDKEVAIIHLADLARSALKNKLDEYFIATLKSYKKEGKIWL